MKLRRADEADSEFLARVILLATRAHLSKGWFDILLDGTNVDCLQFIERLTRTSVLSWWHNSRFWVAEIQGVRAAAVCCFRAGDGYPLSGKAVAEAALATGLPEEQQRQMWERGSYIFSCTLGGGDDLWTLENVATMPEYRRQGLTTALIEEARDEGRRNGFELMQVATFIGNVSAINAYKRVGFRPAEEKRSAVFEAVVGAPGMCRFELGL